jgi:glycosyltransferase involved in cell wall biosynthesis
MIELLKNNFLIISTEHYSFIKDQTECLAPFVGTINNLVRYNPISEISQILPVNSLKNYQKRHLIDLTDTPQNLKVYPTPVVYAPFDFFYRSLGEKHLNSVERSLKKNKIFFDIIHAHATWSSGYVGARLKEKFDVPFVVTAHGYDIYDLPFRNNFWRERIQEVMNSADHVITVSQKNAELIKKLNCSSPVTVISNGYNQRLFYPRNSEACKKILGLPQKKKILLCVGTLEPIKGHEYLILAMDLIRKQRNDIICYIIGDGSRMRHLRRLIKKLHLDDDVKLVGAKRHDEIPLWMNAADLFVLPSIQESFGIVQIEAMACGKPVVSTRNMGSREIISSDDYGVLTPIKDSLNLYKNIIFALNKSWDREKIIEYAQNYSFDVIIPELLNLYSHVKIK